jgi:hypothetical protein
LRDDVELLLQHLSGILTRKLTLLRSIRTEEKNGRYYLKCGDIERLSSSIETCSELVMEIDALDYDASVARNALARTLGIPEGRLVAFLRSSGEENALKPVSLLTSIAAETGALAPEHERLLADMEAKRGEMERERRSLESFGRVLGAGDLKGRRDSSS